MSAIADKNVNNPADVIEDTTVSNTLIGVAAKSGPVVNHNDTGFNEVTIKDDKLTVKISKMFKAAKNEMGFLPRFTTYRYICIVLVWTIDYFYFKTLIAIFFDNL